VYLTDHDNGVTHVFALGEKFEEIGSFTLGEAVSASPAVSDGRLLLRGKDNLYCIK
jgi:outer membrane protein assembly factor BamB